MKKNKLKAAVIGCGNIGADEKIYAKNIRPGTHAGAYKANKNIELVALVDSDKKKLASAKKNFPDARAYDDIGRMFQIERPDIVSIATPTKYHAKHVLSAAKYGCRAILCEKPIAYSITDAEKMVAACKKNKVKLFINHQRHFDPLINKWAKKVRNGLLGKIYQGHIYYSNGLFNNGTHIIDLLRMFLGDIENVAGNFNKATSSKPGDPNADGMIMFKNGANISLHSLSKNYDFFECKIVGENGMLHILDLGIIFEYRKKIENKVYRGYFELSEKPYKEGSARNMMVSAIEHIVAVLNRDAKPLSTGEEGLRTLKALVAFKNSAKKGGSRLKIR